MRRFLLLCLLGGCASGSGLEEWGRECRATMDPSRRLELVRRLVRSGDERAIPVLIDCLDAFRRMAKTPDRDYSAPTVEPNVTVPAEFWGLHVLTGQDFDLDVGRWRRWYERHEGRLIWDGGKRRFVVRE